MPFHINAPEELRQIEQVALAAADPGLPTSDRVAAVESFVERVRRVPWLKAFGPDMASQIVGIVERDLWSFRLRLIKSECLLERANLVVTDEATNGAVAPHLRDADDKQLPSARVQLSGVIPIWAEVVARVERMLPEERDALDSDELLAAMTILALQLVYGPTIDHRGDMSEERFAIASSSGASLWAFLLAGLGEQTRQDMPDFDRRYGWPAYLQIFHRLRGEWLTKPLRSRRLRRHLKPPSVRVDQTSVHGWRRVVLDEVPPGSSVEDRLVLSRFEALSEPLQVTRMPSVKNIDGVLFKLNAEFPWAEGALRSIHEDLRTMRLFGAADLQMSPVLLVGAPGCGKSRLARRLAEELSLPFIALSIAGMEDSRLLTGTARGWASGQPAAVLSHLLRARSASALVLLDEVDKSGDRTNQSPSVTSSLLGFLEPETASRWFDSFLLAECDLSRVVFIGSANSLRGMPKALLSRFRLFHVPSPSPEEMLLTVPAICRDLAKEWGVSEDLIPPLDRADLLHAGDSLRSLKLEVRRVLTTWAQRTLDPNALN